MSPQEWWMIADEKARDQVVGAGGLTGREVDELQAMLDEPDPRETDDDA